MSAPVLTVFEQKASISGKKKKKKTIKNVLDIPNNLKIESQIIQTNCVKKLGKILERLLPTARILLEKTNEGSKGSYKHKNNENQLKKEAKNKRNQLSIGVNALNRDIKSNLISTALLADNIQPKFLIQHLNLLCNHKKIPHLHMPNLRETTKNCLGFPCIAIGFKKDFCDFSEAVEEIKSISQAKKIISNEVDQESESDEEEITKDKIDENNRKNDELQFTYLYRTSTKERIFAPEKSSNNQSQKKKNTGFLNIEENDIKCKNNPTHLPSALRCRKPIKKLKTLEDFENSEMDDHEDFEIPKKKLKKNWIIDKRGTSQNIKYYATNLVRFPSNPNRMRKNSTKLWNKS